MIGQNKKHKNLTKCFLWVCQCNGRTRVCGTLREGSTPPQTPRNFLISHYNLDGQGFSDKIERAAHNHYK